MIRENIKIFQEHSCCFVLRKHTSQSEIHCPCHVSFSRFQSDNGLSAYIQSSAQILLCYAHCSTQCWHILNHPTDVVRFFMLYHIGHIFRLLFRLLRTAAPNNFVVLFAFVERFTTHGEPRTSVQRAGKQRQVPIPCLHAFTVASVDNLH